MVGLHVAAGQVDVNHGGFDLGVAKDVLQLADAAPSPQVPGGEGVAETVRPRFSRVLKNGAG